MVDRERAENMRRLAVRESVKALPQRLPQFSLDQQAHPVVALLALTVRAGS